MPRKPQVSVDLGIWSEGPRCDGERESWKEGIRTSWEHESKRNSCREALKNEVVGMCVGKTRQGALGHKEATP